MLLTNEMMTFIVIIIIMIIIIIIVIIITIIKTMKCNHNNKSDMVHGQNIQAPMF